MARTFYGGRFSDLFAAVDPVDGDYEPGTGTFKAFTSRTGSTQHTDLLTWASAAIGSGLVGPDSNGYMRFQGQDGYTGTYWMENAATGGTRYPIDPVDLADRGGGGTSDVDQLDDLTDVVITSVAAGQFIKYNGTVYVNSGIAADDLSDVAITSPAVKQVIRYNGTTWVNALPLLDDLSDAVITTPAATQVLRYNGTNWVNAAVAAADVTGLAPVASSGSYSDLTNTPTAPTQELYEAVTSGYPTRNTTQYPRGRHFGVTKPTDGNSIDGDLWEKYDAAFPEV